MESKVTSVDKVLDKIDDMDQILKIMRFQFQELVEEIKTEPENIYNYVNYAGAILDNPPNEQEISTITEIDIYNRTDIEVKGTEKAISKLDIHPHDSLKLIHQKAKALNIDNFEITFTKIKKNEKNL